MSKKMIVVVVASVLVLIGGYFLLNLDGNKANNTDNKIGDAENNADREQDGKKMAFSEFIKQGGSYKCEIKQYVSDVESEGIIYVSGNKIRGEITTVTEGILTTNYFILRDGSSYLWSSTAPEIGFIVKVPENDGSSETYVWDSEQVGDYNCENWTEDLSQFALPRSVTFEEYGMK